MKKCLCCLSSWSFTQKYSQQSYLFIEESFHTKHTNLRKSPRSTISDLAEKIQGCSYTSPNISSLLPIVLSQKDILATTMLCAFSDAFSEEPFSNCYN